MTSPAATSSAMSVARLQHREADQAPTQNHTHRQPARANHDQSPDTEDFNEERDADILLTMSTIQHPAISRTLPTCKLRMVSGITQIDLAATPSLLHEASPDQAAQSSQGGPACFKPGASARETLSWHSVEWNARSSSTLVLKFLVLRPSLKHAGPPRTIPHAVTSETLASRKP